MNYLKQIAPLLLTVAVLPGCGGSSGNDSMSGTPTGSSPPASIAPETPAPPVTANFTAVVKEQIAATSETAAPIETNDRNFVFEDNDNPAAFDDVLPPKVE